MKRRDFLKSAGMGAAMVSGGAQAARPVEEKARRPNILHIMGDMQRWETIADRSLCRTPNLNRLARQGMLFNRSYTATTPCAPARAMLATGAYHWHNGIYSNVHAPPAISHDLFPDAVTYHQLLRQAGYHLGYIGKWHTSYRRTPLDFGFHEIRMPIGYNPRVLSALDVPREWKTIPSEEGGKVRITRRFRFPGSDPFALYGVAEQDEETTVSHHLAEEAISMIGRFKGESPWLIEVNFPESIRRYPLQKYRSRYNAADIPIPPSFYDTFENKPGLHRMEAEIWGEATEEDVRESRACYYAAFEQLDFQIGRILDALKESGQDQETLVTYCVDHGEMGGGHHMWGTGWMTYEENYRMPMIARWPGRIEAGVVSDQLVHVHDLAHTYVDAAGAGKLPYRDGCSLVPLFNDPHMGMWNQHIYNAFYGQEYLYVIRMAITDRYKYVFNSFDVDELYDLAEDPHEIHNRIKDTAFQPIVDDMRARIYELMVQTEDPFGDNPPASSGRRRASAVLAPRYLPRGKRLGK